MPRIQTLLTADIKAKLPSLYANEGKNLDDVLVVARLFSPYCNGKMTWYVTEFDGEDTMFGFVALGMGGDEWGYMSLSELQGLRMFGGRLQAVERDTSWRPTPWRDIKASLGQ